MQGHGLARAVQDWLPLGALWVLCGIYQHSFAFWALAFTPKLSQWKCLHWPNTVLPAQSTDVIQGRERTSLEGICVPLL